MKHDPITEPWLEDSSINNIRPADDSLQRVYWTAFWANLGLAGFKVGIGMLGYSRLLLIDGLNSAANAVAITIILFGMHMSRPQKISCDFPAGQGKSQYIITLIVGFILAVGTSTVLAMSIKSFFNPFDVEPVDIGISVALISIMGNLLILYYLKQKSRSLYEKEAIKSIVKLQSLNIASSIVVANSLLVSGLYGLHIAEHVGSICISLIVLGLSAHIIKNSLDGVMDRSCGDQIETRLTEIVYSVDDVKNVNFLRTRRGGQVLLVDLQICLNAELTIRRCDQIVSQVEKRMASDLKGLSYIITIDRCPV